MYEIFYVDLYFVINFLMDFVSLSVGALSASRKVLPWRLFLGAFTGALASSFLVLLPLTGVWKLLLSLPVFGAMIAICFGARQRSRWVKPALFSFGAAVFLGGAAQLLCGAFLGGDGGSRAGTAVLLGSILLTGALYSFWANRLGRKLETSVVSLSISFGGRCEYFYGLVDSGLLIRDPDGGRPVLLLKAEYAVPLLPQDLVQRIEKGELSDAERLISIPIRSVGGGQCLFAFLPERVQVLPYGKRKKKKAERDVLVALDFSRGGYGGCPCLVPLSVL